MLGFSLALDLRFSLLLCVEVLVICDADEEILQFRKEFFGTLNSIFFPKRPEPVLPSPRREGSGGE